MSGINPIQIMSMIIKKQNPQSLVVDYLRSNGSQGSLNLADMIERGDVAGVEQLARNAAQERGLNIDKMKSNLEKQLGTMFRGM